MTQSNAANSKSIWHGSSHDSYFAAIFRGQNQAGFRSHSFISVYKLTHYECSLTRKRIIDFLFTYEWGGRHGKLEHPNSVSEANIMHA